MIFGLTKFFPERFKRATKRRYGVPDVRITLENLALAGYAPEDVIDVGANDATWSQLVRTIWPRARFTLFEPNAAYLEPCRRFLREGDLLEECALSNFEGTARFRLDGSNSALDADKGDAAVRVSMLDRVCAGRRLGPNGLLKVDVQGDDLRVVEGGRETIRRGIAVVILEVSLIPLNPIAPDPLGALARMDELGFRLYDICTFWRRPVDNALWQVDMCFVRKDSGFGAARLGY